MKDIQQLIKKNNQEGRYESIFPKTFTDAVIDRENGAKLTDILAMFNMLFLSYVGSKSLTRLEVPVSLRKTGVWITYVLYDKTVVTEWYAGEAIDDTSFSNDSNWRDGTNSLVGDISISSDGYWVINGEVTTIKAQGEAGITPILRVGSNNHLQVSYTNGNSYIDVSPNPVYTQFRINNNKLEQSVDLGDTWTVVSDNIAAWFRWQTNDNNLGRIQISRDNNTWENFSPEFINRMLIKGFVSELPQDAEYGDIYMVGPYYNQEDSEHANPYYRMWVKQDTWVDAGYYNKNTYNYNYNIKKTYPSVSAMDADKSNPIGTNGLAIQIGDIVTVVNSTTPSENGIYSRIEGGWQFQSSFNFQLLNTLFNGQSINEGVTQDRIIKEFYRISALESGIFNRFVWRSTSSLVYREPQSEVSGYYIDWNNGTYAVNPTFCYSRYFNCKSNQQYCFVNVHSYNWYDKDLNWISGGTVFSGTTPDPTPISPANAKFVRVSYNDSSVIGMYEGTTVPDYAGARGYAYDFTLSRTALKPIVYDDNDIYPLLQSTINFGLDKFLLGAIIDHNYDDGYDYSFANYNRTTKTIGLYKHQKSVIPATAGSLTLLENLTEQATVGKYSVMGNASSRTRCLVDWSVLSQDVINNLYAYHGVGLSPALFHGGSVWAAIDSADNQFAILSSELSRLDSSIQNIVIDEDRILDSTKIGQDSGWSSLTSIFSGWGEAVGILPSNINAFGFKVRARNAPITKIRFTIYENDPTGTVLADVTKDVNIEPTNEEFVVIRLPQMFDNSSNKQCFIMYRCNQLCDEWLAKQGDFPYLPPIYAPQYYSTNGSLTVATLSGGGRAFPITYGTYEKYYELTDEQVENIGQRLQIPDPSSESVGISLPDTLTAVVGDTLQLFFRGMLKVVNPYNYDLLVTCSKGNKYPRYFQFTPSVSDIGDVDFKIQVKNNDGKILGEATSKLKIRNVLSAPASVLNVCCFGDSLTSAGTWCAEADRRLTGTGGTPIGLALSNIKFCGSKLNGTTGYFGVGGWTWSDYTTRGHAAFRFQVSGVTAVSVGAVYSNNGYQYTVAEVNVTGGTGNILCNAVSFSQTPTLSGTLTKVSGNGDTTITFSSWEENSQNPLWNQTTNQMDFVPYANTYCNGHIDVVYTLLSWNGQTPWRTDFTDIINQVKIFADTLHRDFPNAKMKILGIQVPSINGGMGATYGATGTSYADGFGMVITALNQNKAYQDFANLTAYKNWVEFVNVSSQVDSEYNMPYSSYDVNTRNSVAKENRGTNGVHPSDSGYKQIGDVVYRNFIKDFCQG